MLSPANNDGDDDDDDVSSTTSSRLRGKIFAPAISITVFHTSNRLL